MILIYALPVMGLVLLAFICAIIHLVRASVQKRFSWQNLLPLAAIIVGLAIMLFMPPSKLELAADFRWHYAARMEVCQLVKDGNWDEEAIPAKYSAVGTINIWRTDGTTVVTFMTRPGMLSEARYFMYRSDDSVPRDEMLREECKHWKKIEDHWYDVYF